MSFRTWFDYPKLRGSIAPIQHARRGARRRKPFSSGLAFESLENRCMMTAVFSVGNAAVLEGNAGSQRAAVVVSLSEPHGSRVTVDYRTVNGTATAGRDYNSVSGKLTFAKGELSKTIQIPVIGDRVPEVDKSFSVKLSDAKHAKIANRTAVVTILDDEPRISITDVWTKEGNSSTTPFTFTVSLSAAYDQQVTVNYATTNGSASAGVDYTAASGQLVFAPGQTSQTISVGVNGNRLPGPDKSFSVSLSTQNNYAVISKGVGVGTIVDDEPRISISDTYNYGETTFTFSVSLSAAYDQDVTVNFNTADGTAISGLDYVATSGTLTFARGETTKTITVDVLDTTSADKSFSIHLSGDSTNALIANESAFGYWYYDYGYYDSGYYGYYDPGYYYYYDSYYGY
jgi:hypothetical protein